MKTSSKQMLGFSLIALGLAARLLRQGRAFDFKDKIALVTGGSRGLGLILARQLASQGAIVVIAARNADELAVAKADIQDGNGLVESIECDIGTRENCERLIEQVIRRFGRIDILVNNASIIQVGPVESISVKDMTDAMNVNFWGTAWTTLTALPHLKRGSRVVNITSIGGAVAVPHLLPYTAAKFAVRGFSEGLASELDRFGIKVVTVVPGLMRTGSFLNALFKGHRKGEFTWFALGSTLPIISMDAERAGRRIIAACRRGVPLITIGMPANILRLGHDVAPRLTIHALALVNRFLPKAEGYSSRLQEAEPGKYHRSSLTSSPVVALGEKAADNFNERVAYRPHGASKMR